MRNSATQKYSKIIHLSSSSKINDEVLSRLEHLFALASPLEYRDTLIELYHSYLLHEHDSLPANFKDMAEHMCMLLDFLKETELD